MGAKTTRWLVKTERIAEEISAYADRDPLVRA
jgi:hypothetical protein